MATIHQIDNHLIQRLQQENEQLRALVRDWLELAAAGMGTDSTWTIDDMFEQYDELKQRSLEMLGEAKEQQNHADNSTQAGKRRNLQKSYSSGHRSGGNDCA